MTRRPRLLTILALAAAVAAAACSKIETAVRGAAHPAAGAFDKAKLDAAIDKSLGGPDTCVVLADTRSGSEAYRYGSNVACARTFPPCSTFDIPASLVALDSGAATVDGVVKWDGRPQALKSWQRDLSLKAAFKDSVPWFYQKLARDLGPSGYEKALAGLKYGDRVPATPIDQFWMGPQAGGQLGVSTHDQAAFLHRLYAGQLAARPASVAAVEALMVDEIRSGSTVSGKYATCASNSDGSRQVGWWIGRLQGPKADYVFAASIEGDNALPGLEVQTRLKDAFAKAGLWPAMS